MVAANTTTAGGATNQGSKPVLKRVTHTTLVVSDYDKSLDYYLNTLGFEKREDQPYDDQGHRWVEVGLPGDDMHLVLYKPHPPMGGTPGSTDNVILNTADLDGTIAAFKERGVTILWIEKNPTAGPPMMQIADPDGNKLLVTQEYR